MPAPGVIKGFALRHTFVEERLACHIAEGHKIDIIMFEMICDDRCNTPVCRVILSKVVND